MPPSAPQLRGCPHSPGVIYNQVLGIVAPARCKRWDCSYCRRRNAKQLRERIADIAWTAFVTLTMPPAFGAPTVSNLIRQAHALKHLMQWARRHFGDFNYAWVREVAERGVEYIDSHGMARKTEGRLHLHMLWDIPFVPKAALSDEAATLGLGRIVDIQEVHSVGEVAHYVSKALRHYMTKDAPVDANGNAQADFPKGTRRFYVKLGRKRRKPYGWAFTRMRAWVVLNVYFGIDLEGERRYDVRGFSRADGTDPPMRWRYRREAYDLGDNGAFIPPDLDQLGGGRERAPWLHLPH